MNGAARIASLVEQTRRRLQWPAWLRAFGPAALATLVFLALAALGLFQSLPPALSTGASLLGLLAIASLAWRGFTRYRKPSPADSRNLVDALSEDRPATAMIDRPARPTPEAARLWEVHQQRVAQRALTLGAPSLAIHLKSADPFFMRFIAPGVLAGVVVAMGPGPSLQRMADAASPDLGALVGADKLTVNAWVTPPVYTNRAPFELEPGAATQTPKGSEITIRVNAPAAPTLKLTSGGHSHSSPMTQAADGSYQSVIPLTEALDARVSFWGERARYLLTTLPDSAPTVSFTEAITTDKFGRVDFKWQAADDFGVARVQLVLSPVTPLHDAPDDEDAVDLNLPQVEPELAMARAQLDLLRHKWAGLKVNARLRAIDAAGQTGESPSVEYKLPEKLLFQPLARAAAEIRLEVLRDPREYAETPPDFATVELVDGDRIMPALPSRLERAPDGVRKAALMLEGLTYQPETYFLDPVLFMGFSRARAMLNAAHDEAAAAQTDDLLWAVAMRAEYGDFADAEQALEAARQALERALRDGADEDEIKRLMEAFRQAMTDYLTQQMAEALRRGDMGGDQSQAGGQSVGESDLEKMMKALEELAETGATDQARQLLSDMSDMLARMKDFQFTQGENGQPPPEGPLADALRQLGEQQMKQRELNDETRQSNREDQSGPGNDGPSQRQMQDLAERQRQLSEQLAESLEQQSSQASPGQQGREGEAGEGEDGAGQAPDPQSGGDEASGPPSGTGAGNGPPEAQSGQPPAGLGGALGDERIKRRLEDARTAQQEAADALARGDTEAAESAQQRASRALGDAANRLAKRADDMARAAGLNPQESSDDPLGRPSGNGANGDGDETAVPEDMDRQRARDILDELRRRAGERDLTPEEQDYLDRLLDRF